MMVKMNNADEVWVCLGTHRWICSLVNNHKTSKYAFKYYVLAASSLKRIFRCLKPTDLSKVYLDDEGITLKWVMKKG